MHWCPKNASGNTWKNEQNEHQPKDTHLFWHKEKHLNPNAVWSCEGLSDFIPQMGDSLLGHPGFNKERGGRMVCRPCRYKYLQSIVKGFQWQGPMTYKMQTYTARKRVHVHIYISIYIDRERERYWNGIGKNPTMSLSNFHNLSIFPNFPTLKKKIQLSKIWAPQLSRKPPASNLKALGIHL